MTSTEERLTAAALVHAADIGNRLEADPNWDSLCLALRNEPSNARPIARLAILIVLGDLLAALREDWQDKTGLDVASDVMARIGGWQHVVGGA